MTMRYTFRFIILLHIFSVTQTSFIQLTNGSYEDIVIAINPGVPEDDTLIQKLKEMVIDGSSYLFHATGNRLSIRNVKILIPLTWTSKSNYAARTRETYEKADIIVTHPSLKYGDSPYTLQYRGCREQGEYIHLTPNFLLNTSLTSVYGSPGRTFVHEWAHLRWGVFDEYNNEIPYYISGELKVEATRCSVNLKGSNMIQECNEDSCSLRECNVDSTTGLYEQGCLFLLEKVQNVQESIMYSAALPSTTSFCNDINHNIESPSLQNRMCNSRSSWDIISNSTDIISTPPRSETDLPVPTFALIQYKKRVITIACDISGSMNHLGNIDRLFQGAEFFLTQIVETGTYVGIVEFATLAFATSKLVQINNEEDRIKLISLVPSTTQNEGADICQGILEALEVNKQLDGSTAGTEILLVSDGDFNRVKCFADISASGAVIHIIALGSKASEQLEQIAHMTGGQKHFAPDTSNANAIFHAFSALSSENANDTQQSIQLESRSSTLESEGCLNSTIFIDSTVGTSTFFLVTWQADVPSIRLQDPNGKRYTEAQFTNNTLSHSSRLQIPGKAESGAWNYTLCNNLKTNQILGMIVTSKASAENVPPITINVHMNKDTNYYPNPMIIYTSVYQDLLPVTNLHLTAIIEAESGNTVTVELQDNGAGADAFKNDGVYSRYFISFFENGRYNLKVHVESQEIENTLALPRNRAVYIPGYIENGGISMNPPKSSINNDNDLPITVGHISRTVSGGSFIVNNIPTSPQDIIHKPCRITNLEANAQGNAVVLSWTATGDDLDQGQAAHYDLRMSTNPRDLRDNFEHSTLVDISSLSPQLFGSQEKFTFIPLSMGNRSGMVFYFALTAIDKDNQESDISNIAQTVIFTSTTPEPSTVLSQTPHSSTSFHTGISETPLNTITNTNSMGTPTSGKLPSTDTPNTDLYSTIKTSDITITEVENSSSSHISHSIPTNSPQPPRSTDLPNVDTLKTTEITLLPTNYTVPLNTNSMPSVSISAPTENNLPLTGTTLPPTGSPITPTTSLLIPPDNTDTTFSSILSTIFRTVPPTITNNSVTLTDFTTGNTIQQTGKSDSVTATRIPLLNNTTTAYLSTTTTNPSPDNINVTVVVVIVCVAAVLISIIICLTIYFARYYRSASYSSTLV
ncbi:calcium-activated chloride channel regulator 1-like [Rhinoderma darwinii]|uniref:calcium-activated chloride channel regulator 1-like n=1 Tax=Rhinoderma darwinii TaxID=43563 RepID=UPI003F66C8C4